QVTQVRPADAGGGPGQPVGLAVVDAGVAAHVDDRVGLVDVDLALAAGRFVVLVAGERPVDGVTAGVGVGRAGEVQQAAQILVVHPGGAAGRAVRLAIVLPGVAGDREDRVGLGDLEGQGAADDVVVAAAERPILAVAAGVGAAEAFGEQDLVADPG